MTIGKHDEAASAQPGGDRHARPSPFVGLSETSLRFVLLSMATLAAAAYAWQYVGAVILSRTASRATLCVEASLTDASPPFSSVHARCWAENQAHPLALYIGTGLLVTALASLLILVLRPPLHARRHHLRPFEGGPTDGVASAAADLAQRLHVRPPRLLQDPNPTAGARVTSGGLGPPRLVVRSGMALLMVRQPSQFRAVIAHELAHIRNADVRLAELATGAWWALLLVVLLPYLALVVATGALIELAFPVAKFVLLLVAVRLLRNGLLRAREYEADIRAGTLPGIRTALQEALRAGRPSAARPWNSHPSALRRADALDDPAVLLGSADVDLFTLGATAFFLLPALAGLMQAISFGTPQMKVFYSSAAWVVAAGIGAGVWAICWREAVARSSGSGRRSSWLRHALLLTAGMALGAFLSPVPRAAAGIIDRHTPVQWIAIAVVAVAVAALLVTLFGALARLLVSRSSTARRAHRLNVVGLVLALVTSALALDLLQSFVLYSSEEMPLPLTVLATALTMGGRAAGWVAAAVAITACALIVSRAPRRAVGSEQDWALLRDE